MKRLIIEVLILTLKGNIIDHIIDQLSSEYSYCHTPHCQLNYLVNWSSRESFSRRENSVTDISHNHSLHQLSRCGLACVVRLAKF